MNTNKRERNSSDSSTGNYFTKAELMAMENDNENDNENDITTTTTTRKTRKTTKKKVKIDPEDRITPMTKKERESLERKVREEEATGKFKNEYLATPRIVGTRETKDRGIIRDNVAMRGLGITYARDCMLFVPPIPTRWGVIEYDNRVDYTLKDRALRKLFKNTTEMNKFKLASKFNLFATEGVPLEVSNSELTIPEDEVFVDFDEKEKTGTITAIYDFSGGENITIREDILRASRSRNKPLFYVITSQHHSTICIIHNNVLYSIGYGYIGKENPNKALHLVETMNGALYSTDQALPGDKKHRSIMSWVGFLDEKICDNINRYIMNSIPKYM